MVPISYFKPYIKALTTTRMITHLFAETCMSAASIRLQPTRYRPRRRGSSRRITLATVIMATTKPKTAQTWTGSQQRVRHQEQNLRCPNVPDYSRMRTQSRVTLTQSSRGKISNIILYQVGLSCIILCYYMLHLQYIISYHIISYHIYIYIYVCVNK